VLDIENRGRSHPPSTRRRSERPADEADPRRWVSPARRLLPLVLVPILFVHVDRPKVTDDASDVGPKDAEVTEGSVLPLDVNPRVRKWMERFRTDQHDEFQAVLRRRGAYEGLIRQRLRERGMPEELLYLAMMESGLMPRAESSASAVGLWQLMAPTAQEYGLRVDEWVDERRDPVRATNAALDYLSWLHDRYGSWYLAAAAYDAGPARVDRAIAETADSTAHGEALYFDVVDLLPRETREYVPRLVAASLLARDAGAAGFDDEVVRPYRYDRVFVPGGTSLRRVARILDVDARVILGLNPHLIQGMTPPGETYPVRVPVGTAGKVVKALGRGMLKSADD
jgi:peptidoglycan lytic transglycosylase D